MAIFPACLLLMRKKRKRAFVHTTIPRITFHIKLHKTTAASASLDLPSFIARWHCSGTKMPGMRKVKSIYKYTRAYVYFRKKRFINIEHGKFSRFYLLYMYYISFLRVIDSYIQFVLILYILYHFISKLSRLSNISSIINKTKVFQSSQ